VLAWNRESVSATSKNGFRADTEKRIARSAYPFAINQIVKGGLGADARCHVIQLAAL
jgi:hypothetical protein